MSMRNGISRRYAPPCMPKATSPSITPDSLLDMAARARRLAQAITDKVTASRLTEYAEELEARAATRSSLGSSQRDADR